MSVSFLSLPIEVRFHVYELYNDWSGPDPHELILSKAYNELKDSYSAELSSVKRQWRNLLSSCHTIRADIISILWRDHPVILKPLNDGDISFALTWPLRQLVAEVRCKDKEPDCCAVSLSNLRTLEGLAANHPTLDQIEVPMDLQTLQDVLQSANISKCPEHAPKLIQSPALRQLAQDLTEIGDDGGFLHFRILFSRKGTLRSRDCIAKNYADFASSQNYLSGDCKDHEVGQCQRLDCRLLHAIEEIYGSALDNDKFEMYLTFFGFDRHDGYNYVYEASDAMMPIILDAASTTITQSTPKIREPTLEWLTVRYEWQQITWGVHKGRWLPICLDGEYFTEQELDDMSRDFLGPDCFYRQEDDKDEILLMDKFLFERVEDYRSAQRRQREIA